uniref:Uncharacterized protein n=1 Tax=Peronospora matthiolae TaxID=2874970 RepID=A0AAV1UAA5_9STRA
MKVFYIRALCSAGVLSIISDRAYGGIEPDVVASGAWTIDREVAKRQLRTSADVKFDHEERMEFPGRPAIPGAGTSEAISSVPNSVLDLASIIQGTNSEVSQHLKNNLRNVLTKAKQTSASETDIREAITALQSYKAAGEVKVKKAGASADATSQVTLEGLNKAIAYLESRLKR